MNREYHKQHSSHLNRERGNQLLTDALNERGVLHSFRIWDGFAHDWPIWHEMVLHYIGGDGTR